PPVITRDPAPHSIAAGQSVNSSIDASGAAPLSYRWRRNGVDLSDGARITGSATDSLTINPVDFIDAGEYSVTVTNACGPVVSASATLTVTCNTAPTGDINGDGRTDGTDIQAFTAALLARSTSPGDLCRAD